MSSHARTDRKSTDRSTRIRSWKSRRWLIGLLPIVALLMVLLWLAPMIVANSPLRQKIVASALRDFNGTLTVRSASLGWFSPVAAYDIAAVDAHGEPLAEVKSLHSERSLLSLLSNRTKPGTFHAQQPTVHLVLRPDGSNWEDALAGYFAQPSGGDAVDQFQLQIQGAVVEIRDPTTTEPWRVEDLNAAMQWDSNADTAIQLRLAGQIQNNRQPAGKMTVELDCDMGAEAAESIGKGRLAWQVEELPVGPWASLLERTGTHIQASGHLTGKGICEWDAHLANQRLYLERLTGRDLAIHVPQYLGSDGIRTAGLDLRGRIEQQGSSWQLEDVVLVTDFAQLQAAGTLPPLGSGDWSQLIRQLQQQKMQASGQLQLAPIAAMLPNTLRIRSGTQITSGNLDFNLASRVDDTPSFTATLKAAGLAAVEGGRSFTWDKPISAAADFRYSPEGLVIDELVCKAGFLDLEASGFLSEGSATIKGDLDQLAAEAGRFVDLGQLQMAGKLDGDLHWRQAEPGNVEATGQLNLHSFALTMPDLKPWREQQLAIHIAASGRLEQGQISKLETASCTVSSDSDRLHAKLRTPVAQPTLNNAWPLQLELDGQLETWIPRLQPVFSLPGWQLAGKVDLDVTATLGRNEVKADSVILRLDQFRLADTGKHVNIDENLVRIETAGRWDVDERQFSAEDTLLTSSTIAFRAQQVVLQLPGQSSSVSGVVSYRADLNRLKQSFLPSDSNETQVRGTATGVVRASHEGTVTRVDWSSDIQDLVYATQAKLNTSGYVTPVAYTNGYREVWREPNLKLTGRKHFDHQADSLFVEEFTAITSTAKLRTSGRLDQVTTRVVADLTGTIDYDLANVTRVLQSSFGNKVRLMGQEQGQFRVQGPLVNPVAVQSQDPHPARNSTAAVANSGAVLPDELAGSFRFGWQSGDVYGLRFGNGGIEGTLSKNVVRIGNLDVPLNKGRVKASSQLDLNYQPVRLMLDRGPMIENVQISPEMCEGWLKYVAPLLAEATRAEGTFSINLDDVAIVPLPDTQRSTARGTMTIHTAQVGPGPLAQEFLATAQQIRSLIEGRTGGGSQNGTWLTVPQQQVKFDVKDGRVQHHGLTVTAGDIVVRTSGSVGLDQTLALLAEVPIQDAWIAQKPVLVGLKGTTLQLPIRGTLAEPKIDRRALSTLNQQIIQKAAGGLIEKELGRGLQQLFGPRP